MSNCEAVNPLYRGGNKIPVTIVEREAGFPLLVRKSRFFCVGTLKGNLLLLRL